MLLSPILCVYVFVASIIDLFFSAGEQFVRHLAPYTDKDFRTSNLGDRIKDPDCLVYLYPDIPKAKAFSKFWTNSPGTSLCCWLLFFFHFEELRADQVFKWLCISQQKNPVWTMVMWNPTWPPVYLVPPHQSLVMDRRPLDLSLPPPRTWAACLRPLWCRRKASLLHGQFCLSVQIHLISSHHKHIHIYMGIIFWYYS